MRVYEVEIAPYDLETEDQIDIIIKKTGAILCSFHLRYGDATREEQEWYAKSFVRNHNMTCKHSG